MHIQVYTAMSKRKDFAASTKEWKESVEAKVAFLLRNDETGPGEQEPGKSANREVGG